MQLRRTLDCSCNRWVHFLEFLEITPQESSLGDWEKTAANWIGPRELGNEEDILIPFL